MVLCFSCGAELLPSLEFAGSLRCQDCRDTAAPLRATLVEQEAPTRPTLTLITSMTTLQEPADRGPFAAA